MYIYVCIYILVYICIYIYVYIYLYIYIYIYTPIQALFLFLEMAGGRTSNAAGRVQKPVCVCVRVCVYIHTYTYTYRPCFSFWKWREAGLAPWQEESKKMLDAAQRFPWPSRVPQAFWRGKKTNSLALARTSAFLARFGQRQVWCMYIYVLFIYIYVLFILYVLFIFIMCVYCVCICSIYMCMYVYTCVLYRFGQRQVHGCKRAGAREAAPSGWIFIYITFCMRACGGYIGIYILGCILRYRHVYPRISPYRGYRHITH
jgi:hypothetical protein